MKYPTLHKVSLLTIALLASVGLTVQAGPTPKKTTKIQRSMSMTASDNIRAHLPRIERPADVLYDQYDNAGSNATSSQDFEASLDSFDDFLADDFVVPGDQTWSIDSVDADGVYFNGAGPAENFNVFIYSDAGGLPGALVESRIGMAYAQAGSTFSVTVSPAVSLGGGTYWVSVQSRMDFTPFGQWGWTDRTVQSNNAAAWQNPGGGFGVCTTWGRRGDDCLIDPGVPDQVFRLNGTSSGGTPTPTPTVTPTPAGALWYNGDFNGDATGNGLANQENILNTGLFSRVYDDFNVPDSGGWDIDSVFSNNLNAFTTVTGATYEIRSDVSVGNPGTLIASGTTASPVVTPTGRFGFGLEELMVEITGLSIHLDPGTYHLNVAPIGSADGQTFNSTTAGENCIGTPCGDNDTAFWDSDFFGVFFVSTDDPNVCAPPNVCPDFSMGVNGEVSGGGGGNLELTANGRKVNEINTVNLHWRGATSSDIDVYRSQQGGGGFMLIATTPNDGSYKDSTGTTGHASFKYKVCEAGTQNCSNKKAVLFKQ